MYKKLLLSVFVLLFFAGSADSQQLPLKNVVPGQWIKSWLLCGPIPLQRPKDPKQSMEYLPGFVDGFTTDYLTKAGGEKNLTIKAGDVVKYPKGIARWKLYNSPDSIITLDKSVGFEDPVFSYAYTEIQAEETGVWFIGLGTHDGGNVWLNGLKIFDYHTPRGIHTDGDLIPVKLNKGKNTLLFKIEERYGNGGFCVRFHPFSVNSLAERGDLLTVIAGLDGQAKVVSKFGNPVLQQVIQNLEFEVLDRRDHSVVKEQRSAAFCGSINLKTDEYQPYTASVRIDLISGETIRQKYSFYAGKRVNHTLFSIGKSDYRIAIDGSASESERWAAGELRRWMKEISGIEMPIQPLDMSYPGHQIIIGHNQLIKEKTGDYAPADQDESFRYCNSGADILIYGGKGRGTMYGVMAFLENEFGCRWYTPTVNNIPKRDELVFNYFEHSEHPGVRVRNDFYAEAFNPEWAAQNRVNGAMGYRKQPGGVESYWAVHTFYPLMPPTEFFSNHPEYYSLIDGKRIFEQAQLCLSNPDVLKIITERIKKRMRESPEYLIYDVSQNDWYNPCQCEKCQEIVKREGGESGIMIWFVNQIAESVEKEFPDKFIGTLAYLYTRTPPKHIHPRSNVVVRLCSIECCFSHDFKTCPENQSFLKDLTTWSTLAPHLYIWDYVVDFAHFLLPYPNFKVLQPNIQTFRDNNSIGIMEQGAYQCRGGEFAELRSYLIAKLFWNPECDADKVIDDFINGYYGRSGKLVRQYFDKLQGRITPEAHIHPNLSPDDRIFSEQFIKESFNIFEEAKKVADNPDVLRRVELSSLPVLYLKCRRFPVLAKYDGSYARLCAIAEREGVTHFAEAGEVQRLSFHKMVEDAK